MMKQFAVMFLLLVSGSLTLAQQPSDWRPSIAEDNKAAKWTDTADFIVNAINNGATTRSDIPRDNQYFRTVWAAYNASSPNECEIKVSQLREFRANQAVTRWEAAIDLRQVDPLSIKVEQWWRPGVFQLELSGSNNGTFEKGTVWQSKKLGTERFIWANTLTPLPADLLSFNCDKDKSCSSQPTAMTSDAFPVTDMEMAKRLARAFMHAALLCGGVKAVSPF